MNSKTNLAAPTKSVLPQAPSVNPKLMTLLAEHLVASNTLPMLIRDLDDHGLDHGLEDLDDPKEVEDQLQNLFQNHPTWLTQEDQQQAASLPDHLKGENLLESLLANTSNEDS